MKHFAISVIPFIFSVAGCSTTPVTSPPVEGSAIIIQRDAGLAGSGTVVHVLINERSYGKLSQGDHVTVKVQPGQYRVVVQERTLGIESGTRSHVVDIRDNAAIFRVGYGSYGFIFDRVK